MGKRKPNRNGMMEIRSIMPNTVCYHMSSRISQPMAFVIGSLFSLIRSVHDGRRPRRDCTVYSKVCRRGDRMITASACANQPLKDLRICSYKSTIGPRRGISLLSNRVALILKLYKCGYHAVKDSVVRYPIQESWITKFEKRASLEP